MQYTWGSITAVASLASAIVPLRSWMFLYSPNLNKCLISQTTHYCLVLPRPVACPLKKFPCYIIWELLSSRAWFSSFPIHYYSVCHLLWFNCLSYRKSNNLSSGISTVLFSKTITMLMLVHPCPHTVQPYRFTNRHQGYSSRPRQAMILIIIFSYLMGLLASSNSIVYIIVQIHGYFVVHVGLPLITVDELARAELYPQLSMQPYPIHVVVSSLG